MTFARIVMDVGTDQDTQRLPTAKDVVKTFQNPDKQQRKKMPHILRTLKFIADDKNVPSFFNSFAF